MATKRPRRSNLRTLKEPKDDAEAQRDLSYAEAIAQVSVTAEEVAPSPRTGNRFGGARAFGARMFDSLQDRNFRWFFASMFGWFASMNMQMLVRGYLVYELTDSYAALGIVSLANAIPGLFLSLPGGVLADRVSKKLVIQVGQGANMLVAGILAGLMLADLIAFWHLLACAIVQGGINALIMPARQSMVSEVVAPERLMNAVALNSSGMNFMRLAAPAGGGAMLTVLGPGWVYLFMAGLYGAGALLLTPVRLHAGSAIVSNANPTVGQGLLPSMLAGLKDIGQGFQYMRQDRTVSMILIVSLLIVLVSMPYQMLLPGFAKDVLGAGPGRLGILMSLTGVGSLAGSLVIASLPPTNRGRILLLSSLLLGIALVAFSASGWYWLTAAIMIVIGIGQSGRMSISNVLLQAYTEPAYRGRVMSVYMLEFSLVSFGTFAVGIVASILGAQVALAITSLALIALSAGFMFMPRMRDLP